VVVGNHLHGENPGAQKGTHQRSHGKTENLLPSLCTLANVS
jgi:hypothetical protein